MQGKVTGYLDKQKIQDNLHDDDSVKVEFESSVKEILSLKELKCLVKTCDSHFLDHNLTSRFNLPFQDEITPSLLQEAQFLWSEGNYPDIMFVGSKTYGVPAFLIEKNTDCRLNFDCEVNHWQTCKSSMTVYRKEKSKRTIMETMKSNRPGSYLSDLSISAIASAFNKWQNHERNESPEYKPAIMFDINFCQNLLDFKIEDSVRWLRIKVDGLFGRYSAGVDIYRNTSNLYFPLNLGNSHWVLFEVNPNDFHQTFYCSLWQRMRPKAISFSKRLHEFLDYHFKLSMGIPHHSSTVWSRDLVCDDHEKIGNMKQTEKGMDCGLHVGVIPVLRQANVPLKILGVNPENASLELRVRLTLTLATGKFYFKPNMEKAKKLQEGMCETEKERGM